MSGVASADPDALDGFAVAARDLSERQRRTLRQFELAVEMAGRDPKVHAAATTAARSLRTIVSSLDELALDAARTADAFRRADRVLAALGAGGRASGGFDAWDLDVPIPGADWEFSWRAPGFPFWAQRWVGDHARLDVELGAGPRIEGGIGLGVVDGVLRLGAELEGTFGAWAKAAVASGFGPFLAVAEGELFVGASATTRAAISVGRNGMALVGGASALAGAKASGEVTLHAGPVGAGASGAVTAGIGARAELEASVAWERVRFRYDLGATLGLGFELGGELHVKPRDLFQGTVDLGEDALGVGAVVVGDMFQSGKGAVDAGKGLVGRFLP